VKLIEVDNRSRWSQRMRGRKNTKQKKNKGSSEVLGMMERVYSRK